MILNEFDLTTKQISQFNYYFLFLIEENKKFNLTNITDESEVYIKHFYDSLKVRDIIDLTAVTTICDIGSGAGFPGIPLKILFPHLKLTIIEPTNKRINFLKELVRILDLDNIEFINQRAEDAIINKREFYDVVTARAVANLAILLELCIPFVKVNGAFLALKGSAYLDEVNVAINAFDKLSCHIEDKIFYELFENLGTRVILKIIKDKETNHKYPRKYFAIKKKHL